MFCSGTLIAPRVVLTAAHCFGRFEPHELEVLFGADITSPDEIVAVVDGFVHPDYVHLSDTPETSNDVALLVLKRTPEVSPATLPEPAFAELVASASLRVVGFGSTGPGSPLGQRAAGTATIDSVESLAIWTDDTGVPCGGDSGGSMFIDTVDGEQIAGVTKGSAGDCTGPGIAMRVDAYLDEFILPRLADVDIAPADTRPAFDPTADYCDETCVDTVDCPLGMLCLDADGSKHCGYRFPGVNAFGDVCDGSGEEPCVPVGQGADRECRQQISCDSISKPAPEGCGCRTGGTAPEPFGLLLVLVGLAALRRRGWSRCGV